jgi:hypothetical protein
MRSWMTLQPGERFDCFGCHEDNNGGMPIAPSQITAKPLEPFYDLPQKAGSFHFPDVIQPVLTRNCVKSGCHDDAHQALTLTGDKWLSTNTDLTDVNNKEAYRTWLWSYWNLTKSKYVNSDLFFSGQTEGIKPYSVGSPKSALAKRILGESVHAKNITTFQPGDREKILAWIDLAVPHSGTYTDDMLPEHTQRYLDLLKRRQIEETIEAENIAAFVAAGGYNGAAYGGTGIADGERGRAPGNGGSAYSLSSGLFAAHYSSAAKQLSIRLPSEGVVTVIDLAGRRMVRKIIGQREFRKGMSLRIPAPFPAGIYVVKFSGLAGTAERVAAIF